MNIRVSMLLCGLWTLVFTIPAFLVLRDRPRPRAPRVGVVMSYRLVWRSIRGLWATSRHTVYFLLASALFRDGLAGVFAFGAILAHGTFGMSAGDVIVFGAAANIVAGFATMAFGLLDDRIGPKRVILISLGSLVVLGVLIFVLHDGGPVDVLGARPAHDGLRRPGPGGLTQLPRPAHPRGQERRDLRPLRDDRAGGVVHVAGRRSARSSPSARR